MSCLPAARKENTLEEVWSEERKKRVSLSSACLGCQQCLSEGEEKLTLMKYPLQVVFVSRMNDTVYINKFIVCGYGAF